MVDYNKLIKRCKRNKRKEKRRRALLIIAAVIFVFNGITGEDNWITKIGQAAKAKREEMSIELVDKEFSNQSGIKVKSVRATSTLKNSSSNNYGAYNVIDKDLLSSWQEGEDGAGEGAQLRIKLRKKGLVNYIVIYNGSHESEEKYYSNNRIKGLRVQIGDEEANVLLEDKLEPQVLEISGAWKTKEVILEILSVYEGTEYNDTAVSEIELH